MQYGSTDYHKQSLRNLKEAVRRTRRLCAVVLDTFGRELVIRREYEVDEQVRPTYSLRGSAALPVTGTRRTGARTYREATF